MSGGGLVGIMPHTEGGVVRGLSVSGRIALEGVAKVVVLCVTLGRQELKRRQRSQDVQPKRRLSPSVVC